VLSAFAAAIALPPTMAWAQSANTTNPQVSELEKTLDGRIGVYALDTGSGRQFAHRADERFPLCSTFKVIAAGAILHKSAHVPGLLQQHVRYTKSDLVAYSPVTEKHVADGMTVSELCAAALQYSDNTAGNLLMKMIGGPAGVTKFASAIGNKTFRLDRWETALNEAIPGDPRDTSTPQAMAHSLERLLLGNILQPDQRAQLKDWMMGNTTGAKRIKAGVPSDWEIGDKTGTGDYGSANDLAILMPSDRAPIIMAIYTTRRKKDAEARNDIIAAAAKIAVTALSSALA
jgi:beta-lactamase class A